MKMLGNFNPENPADIKKWKEEIEKDIQKNKTEEEKEIFKCENCGKIEGETITFSYVMCKDTKNGYYCPKCLKIVLEEQKLIDLKPVSRYIKKHMTPTATKTEITEYTLKIYQKMSDIFDIG